MEGKRLEIEEKKIQSQMAKENAESILKTRELDIKEAKLALDAYVEGASNLLQKEEREKDRQIKQTEAALNIFVA